MTRLPMIQVPAIKDANLARYIENLLAPYVEGSEELKRAQAAVAARAMDRRIVGTFADHCEGYRRVILEAAGPAPGHKTPAPPRAPKGQSANTT